MKSLKVLATLSLATIVLAGCSSGTTNNQSSNNQSTNNSSQNTQQNQTNTQTATVTSGLDNQAELVKTIATEFQKQYPELVITSISLEAPSKPYNFHIDAVDNMNEYEFMYHVAQKHLMKHGEKMLDAGEQNGVEKNREGFDLMQVKNIEDIFKIALANDSAAQVTGWELDKDNGKVVWDIKVMANGAVKEVKIDDATGTIISTEAK